MPSSMLIINDFGNYLSGFSINITITSDIITIITVAALRLPLRTILASQ